MGIQNLMSLTRHALHCDFQQNCMHVRLPPQTPICAGWLLTTKDIFMEVTLARVISGFASGSTVSVQVANGERPMNLQTTSSLLSSTLVDGAKHSEGGHCIRLHVHS